MTNLKGNHTKGKALTKEKLAELLAWKLAKLAENAALTAEEASAMAAAALNWFKFQSAFAT